MENKTKNSSSDKSASSENTLKLTDRSSVVTVFVYFLAASLIGAGIIFCLSTFENSRATRLFNQADNAAIELNYNMAIQKADELIEKFPRFEQAKNVSQLKHLWLSELTAQQSLMELKRLAESGEYKRAIEGINALIKDYPNSRFINEAKTKLTEWQEASLRADIAAILEKAVENKNANLLEEALNNIASVLTLDPANQKAIGIRDEIKSLQEARRIAAEREKNFIEAKEAALGFERDKDWEKAIEAYKKALSFKPDDKTVNDRLESCQSYLKLKQMKAAQDAQNQVEDSKLAADKSAAKQNAQSLWSQAEQLEESGNTAYENSRYAEARDLRLKAKAAYDDARTKADAMRVTNNPFTSIKVGDGYTLGVNVIVAWRPINDEYLKEMYNRGFKVIVGFSKEDIENGSYVCNVFRFAKHPAVSGWFLSDVNDRIKEQVQMLLWSGEDNVFNDWLKVSPQNPLLLLANKTDPNFNQIIAANSNKCPDTVSKETPIDQNEKKLLSNNRDTITPAHTGISTKVTNDTKSTAVLFFAEITTDNVYVRSGPGTNYYYCSKLRKGERVGVVGDKFGWYQITPPAGCYTWISSQYVTNNAQDRTMGVVTAEAVRVYAGSDDVQPMHSTSCLVKLNKGDKITLLGEQTQGYCKIAPPEGAYLWVSNQYTKPLRATGGTQDTARQKNVQNPDTAVKSQAQKEFEQSFNNPKTESIRDIRNIIAEGRSLKEKETNSNGVSDINVLKPDYTQTSGNAVVIVNGKNITEDEVDARMKQILDRAGKQLDPNLAEQYRKRLRSQLIDAMISECLLDNEVSKANITVTESDINNKIDETIKQQGISMDTFKSLLASKGQSYEQFQQQVKKAIGYEKLLERQGSLQIRDEEAFAYYRENEESFRHQEQVRASHILIKSASVEKAAAKAKAEKLLKQVRQGGGFAAIAKENSDCPSNVKGGDLGFFGRGVMVREFEDAAFAMQPGQISGIVETQFGYHIIKVTERRQEGITPYEDAKNEIIKLLKQKQQGQLAKQYIEKLKTDAKIVYPSGKPEDSNQSLPRTVTPDNDKTQSAGTERNKPDPKKIQGEIETFLKDGKFNEAMRKIRNDLISAYEKQGDLTVWNDVGEYIHSCGRNYPDLIAVSPLQFDDLQKTIIRRTEEQALFHETLEKLQAKGDNNRPDIVENKLLILDSYISNNYLSFFRPIAEKRRTELRDLLAVLRARGK